MFCPKTLYNLGFYEQNELKFGIQALLHNTVRFISVGSLNPIDTTAI